MIRLIVSVDEKLGIAKDGQEPGSLPGERKHFKELTMQHGGIMLMGRLTYEQIGRALPGRQSFVLSSTMPDTEGITIVRDLPTFLASHPDVWVIGGASVYEQTLLKADELYITRLHADLGCDQFFPTFSTDDFRLVEREPDQHENGLTFHYEVYSRTS